MEDVARDDVMTPGQRFRTWVLGQHVEGYRIFARDDMRLCVEGASGRGEVNFYDMGATTFRARCSTSSTTSSRTWTPT